MKKLSTLINNFKQAMDEYGQAHIIVANATENFSNKLK